MPTVKDRSKKRIPEMMPFKKWFSVNESCAYLDMSINNFHSVAVQNNLSVSVMGAKRYYKVIELENLLERNIIINQ